MTTTTEQRRAKQLERVRALFAKAESTPYPEEAETFRAKADELMTAYALEQWQVDEAQAGTQARPKPEVRQMDFSWWNRGTNQREYLWSMFHSVARHCRCTVALRGYGDRAHEGSWDRMPVIGLPSDLDYLDMLFTHLMLQMGRQLHPQVDTRQTVGENALRMRQAGMGMRKGRDAMAPLLWQAGMLPLTPAQEERFDVREGDTWRQLPDALQKSLVGRVRRAINDEANRQGVLVDTEIHPAVWQRSFADGFVSRVSSRLYAMRQQGAYKGTGMELALVDIAQQGANLYDEMWPEPEDDGKGSKGRSVSREVRYSHRAAQAGKAAGDKADIVGHPSKGLGGRKGLPGGGTA